MSCKSLWRSSLIPLLSALIELSPAAVAAQVYEITNLGTLCDPSSEFSCLAPDGGSRAFDVNNWGRVVGTSLWVDGPLGCFRTAPNQAIKPTDRLALDVFAQSLACVAYSINDNGSVVGTRWNTQLEIGDPLAFVYGAQMTTLKTLLDCPMIPGPPIGCRGSYGFALNNTGRIVGTAQTHIEPNFPYHAFRVNLPADSLEDLGTLPLPNLENTSEAAGINEQNFIVGSSYTIPGGVVQRAVLFTDKVSDLGTLGGSACTFCSSAANAINNVGLGQVVGWATPSVNGPRHAFMLELKFFGNSDMVDLGDLCAGNANGLCRSEAFAINDFGQIVGESQWEYGNQSTHAFTYRAQTGVMQDLNSSLSLVDRVLWELTDARGINDLGQIVGTGVYLGQHVRAYRLDPPPIQLAANLDEVLEHFNLADAGVEQSLRGKLGAIQNAVARNDLAAACGQTNALDQEVQAQAGRALTERQATTMMAGTTFLHGKLNCR